MAALIVNPLPQCRYRSSGRVVRIRVARRGSAITSVVIGLTVASALAVTAWVARPAYLHARVTSLESVAARSERHQEVIELIAGLISSSVEVAAIYPRGMTPYAEIVLRIAGEGEAVKSDEIALLSHSRLLQTVTLYVLLESEETFDHAELSDRGFPDRWRGNPQVEPRLLASGLSDMHVQRAEDGMVRIALTWAEDSADGEDEAMVFVHCQLTDTSEQQ